MQAPVVHGGFWLPNEEAHCATQPALWSMDSILAGLMLAVVVVALRLVVVVLCLVVMVSGVVHFVIEAAAVALVVLVYCRKMDEFAQKSFFA